MSDLAERVTAGEISVKEAAQLASGLLIAGHETTANMIGIGVLALLENPEQLAILRDTDDPKVVANAVEELLRYLSIIQNGQRRVATEDIEIAGRDNRAGEGIIIDLSPANWDPEKFPDPDHLDVQRDNADQNLAFGYGRHQCVGQQLARAELQIVFSHPAAPHPDAGPGHADRGDPVQARQARLRRLRTTRHVVKPAQPSARLECQRCQHPPLYPPGGFGAPKDRHGQRRRGQRTAGGHRGLLRGQPHLGVRGHLLRDVPRRSSRRRRPASGTRTAPTWSARARAQTFLPLDFSRVLMQYDDLAGAATNNIEARIARAARGRRRQGTGVPQRGAGAVPLPGQGRCASGCSASTTSTSPSCRSAATATSTASG